MKNQKNIKSNDETEAKKNSPAGQAPASSGESILGKAHAESLSSMTGIKLSGEDSHVIVLALPTGAIYYIKNFVIPILALAGLVALYFLRGIAFLFVLSFVFAYIINPPVLAVEKYLKNKTLSILSVYLVLFALFMGLMIPAITTLSTEVADLGNKMQKYSETFKGMYRNLSQYVQRSEDTWWFKSIEKYLTGVIELPGDAGGNNGSPAGDGAGTVNGYRSEEHTSELQSH